MNNKVILVTGGTGSFGQKFTEIVTEEHNLKARSEAKSAEQLPLVTIIPSLNHGQFIERTLLSILRQGYPNKEIIVVDGGSTDQTLEILQKYSDKVRWLSEEDEGYAHAVNKGLRLAQENLVGALKEEYNPDATQEGLEIYCRNDVYLIGLVYEKYLLGMLSMDGSYISQAVNITQLLSSASLHQGTKNT